MGQEGEIGLVTLVVPARNEEAHIGACLRSLQAQDHHDLEILVVDGASSDATRTIVRTLAASDPRIRLLANDRRIVPVGLNLALRQARGRWVVRVDAHATVPPDYVRLAATHLRDGRWGGVGGRKDGVGITPAGRAIAAAMSSRFGVGGSTYHHGVRVRTVDHIPFGAYPTDLVRELGGWDERLVTNQDFEFDYRLRAAGHDLLFDPALAINWHCRQRILDLFRQYRRYGRGKTDVLRLHPRSASPRHLAAPVLVGWLAIAFLVGVRRPALGLAATAPYAAGLGVASWRTSRRLDAAAGWRVPLAFAAMHLGWGIGFLEGMVSRRGSRPDGDAGQALPALSMAASGVPTGAGDLL